MKKLYFTLALIVLCIECFAQSFKLTPVGVVDAKDHSKNFVVVHIENASQEDLFNAAQRHITSAYTRPQNIMSILENDFIALDRVVDLPFSDDMHLCACRVKYRINLEFKDSRYKLEFIIISMQMLYGGKLYDITYVKKPMRWGFFKKNGELTDGGTLAKLEIEALPNNIISGISKQLSNRSSDDW